MLENTVSDSQEKVAENSDLQTTSSEPGAEKEFISEQNKNNQTFLIIACLFLLCLVLVMGAYIVSTQEPKKENLEITSHSQSQTVTSESNESQLDVSTFFWVNDLAYVPVRPLLNENKDDNQYISDVSDTYEVIAGFENASQLVRATRAITYTYEDNSNYVTHELFLFIVDTAGNATYLENYYWSGYVSLEESGILPDYVKVSSMTIPQLTPTQDISYEGQTLFSAATKTDSNFNVSLLSDRGENISLLSKIAHVGDLYLEITDRNNYQNRAFFVVTPDQVVHPYRLYSSQIMRDDASAKINFTNQSWDNEIFHSSLDGGCGIMESSQVKESIIAAPRKEDLELIGTFNLANQNGEAYRLTGGPVLESIYAKYVADRSGLYPPDSDNEAVSFEEYKKLPTHFVFQDGLGIWNIRINGRFGELAECGKPVVYLYPEKDTVVNVAVAADVRVSEPLYPATTGWENVLARPNGQLTYEDETYDSLYWEGLGHGPYPEVENQGLVVKQEQLWSTLEEQMRQLGLNEKERADFKDFWHDRLPKTPYIKLTWLTTREMNELAPLSVSPAPDTLIRVFLDAQGLNEPIQLKAQALSAPERKGFTLVEWGGLLKSY